MHRQPHHVPLQVHLQGPDRARYEVGDVVDEIHDYIQARYVYRNVEVRWHALHATRDC